MNHMWENSPKINFPKSYEVRALSIESLLENEARNLGYKDFEKLKISTLIACFGFSALLRSRRYAQRLRQVIQSNFYKF